MTGKKKGAQSPQNSQKELKKLNKHRDAIKLNVEEQVQQVDATVTDDSVTIVSLQSAIEKLQEYRTFFREESKLVWDLMMDEDDDEVDKDMKDSDAFVGEMLDIIVRYQAKQKEMQAAEQASVGDHSNAGSSGQTSSGHQHQQTSVKLPKFEMEKFDGDSMKWQEFWDSFKSTVHNNEGISDIDKFKYLKCYLSGEPLSLTAGYDLTAANYRVVVEALEERYGDPQASIFAHIMAMLTLPEATSDLKKLQFTYDECERHIRSLAALSVPESTFGLMFTPMILSKLPYFVRTELHRKQGSTPWTLENLRTLLREEIRARSRSQAQYKTSSEGQAKSQSVKPWAKPDSKKNDARPERSTASQLSTTAKKEPTCSYCTEKHYSEDCTKYSTLQQRKTAATGRCYRCLRNNHKTADCRSKWPCRHCKKNDHHRSLCPEKFGEGSGKKDTIQTVQVRSLNPEAEEYVPSNANQVVSHNKDVFLQTAVATVLNKDTGKTGRYRLLFDDAGSRTFITCEKAKELGLKVIGEDTVAVAGFEDRIRRTRRYKVVKFYVLDKDGEEVPIVANVTEYITADIDRQPIDVEKYPFVKTLPLAEPLCDEPQSLQVDILLAADYYYDFVTDGIIRCSGGTVFVPSRLGYLTAGVSDSKRLSKKVSTMLVTMDRHSAPDYDLERFWKLEFIGVKEQVDTKEDDVALQKFRDTVAFKDGRYQVTWPWASDQVELPENFGLAKARLTSLLKKLKSNEEVLRTYDQTFKDQLEKGVIEEAPEEPTGPLVHYLPHHCVITPSKTTTKVRVVYDASSKTKADLNSLNDCLLRGPLFLSDLCGLMMRFRLQEIGVVADIEKAFLQVELQEQERDVTRFLWVKDPAKLPTPDNLCKMRFRRVFFGAKSSPFLLEATVRHHMLQWNTATSLEISDNIYVDNVVLGKPDVETAAELYKESKAIFQAASMNLREWYSNSAEFKTHLQGADCGQDSKTKVLGLMWDTMTDTLSCSVGKPTQSPVTKRKILHELASVYDPCGWFSAVTVSGKILMQDIWAEKHGWDETLPDNIVQKWESIASSLQALGKIQLPRISLLVNGASNIQLHVFCDASKRAYAACGYLRVERSGQVHVSLVFARSRVSPLKSQTIPKLELMAVVIGVRLLEYLNRELRLDDVSLSVWSDSQCVLHWLNQTSLSTVFVTNRVKEIQSHRDVHFRYVPTKDNPADVVTKGCSASDLKQDDLWWHGPGWLSKPSEEWPIDAVPVDIRSYEESPESAAQLLQTEEIQSTNEIVDIERFSQFNRLVRTVAWLLRFKHNSRKASTKQKGHLTPQETHEALNVVIRQVQRARYADILDGSAKSRTNPLVRQMDLFVDNEGLIRCKSRFAYAELPETAKSPILLPRDCHFTTLVIRERHSTLAHAGVAHTLASLRQEYWIVHGRSQVKKVIGRCVPCRKFAGGPYKIPRAPDLPAFRVNSVEPFSCVGIDYLGPLYIRALGDEQKVWVCLFVCTAVRAVHLEVVTALSTEQFLLCFRRFTALYGVPRVIVSDNATQFHAAQKTLADIWHDVVASPTVQDYATTKGITWKFIVEKAPWMGGMYERLIKSVKEAMKKTVNRRKLTLTELQTTTLEIAAILNSRPLVYVEDSVGDEALTPGHFLLSGRARRMAIVKDDGEDQYVPHRFAKDQLILEWRRIQAVIDDFWICWRNRYLLGLLQERGKDATQRATACFRPQAGNVVLIKDDIPRLQWKLGKVTEVVLGTDGQIRSAMVRTAGNKVLHRPVKLLFPLEEGQPDPVVPMPDIPDVPARKRLPRRAAKMASEQIRHQLQESDEE